VPYVLPSAFFIHCALPYVITTSSALPVAPSSVRCVFELGTETTSWYVPLPILITYGVAPAGTASIAACTDEY
jgi:hypothetical protein